MKKFKKVLFAFLLLTMCFSMSSPASAAVKLSAKKITLTVGQSKTLKIKGTKKKVKWSSSKKSVATVSSKGKVKAKKKGTATITAKVGKKKYKCKVTVKNKKTTGTKKDTNQSTAKSGGITQKSYSTPMGIVVFCKNNYSYTVNIDVDCLFYGQSGNFISRSAESNYATPSGSECVLLLPRTYDTSLWTCKSYKISVKAEKTKYTSTGHRFNTTTSMGVNSAVVEIKNNGYSNDFTTVAVVFYKNGNIVGCRERYADVKSVGSSDILEFYYPYDYNYDTIYPDDCKVYINSSYKYVW